MDASHEFLQSERLGDVVVAASSQTLHSVGGGALGGEEQHRQLMASGAEGLQDFEAIHVAEHDVEDNDIGREAVDRPKCAPAVGCGFHCHIGQPQRRRDEERNVLLVIDHQNPRTTHSPSILHPSAGFLNGSSRISEGRSEARVGRFGHDWWEMESGHQMERRNVSVFLTHRGGEMPFGHLR